MPTEAEKHRFDEAIERHIADQVVDREWQIGQSNQSWENDRFRAVVDTLDGRRRPKNYSWQSDIHIPAMTTIVLTQSANDAARYFNEREFVQVYMQDEGDRYQGPAKANQELINRTLNRRDLHYYPKYIRAKTIHGLAGRVYACCWWEQEKRPVKIGSEKTIETSEPNENGKTVTKIGRKDIYEERAVVDKFNFDIVDQRNVCMSNEYVYSLQDKRWISFRFAKTVDEIIEDSAREGYFNLNMLAAQASESSEAEASRDTTNEDEGQTPVFVPKTGEMDVIKRYGKFWCLVDKGENGSPKRNKKGWIEVKPGIDKNGAPLPGAELREAVITTVVGEKGSLLIGFHLQPYKDAQERPYRPIIRGLCYFHPTKDGGMGDGEHAVDLQTGIDDSTNVSQDRVMLATMPVFKSKKYAIEDPSTIYVQPGHNVEMENPDADLKELTISDNIQGALQQTQYFYSFMQQLTATYPTTMGDMPELSSTTATAVSEAGSRADTRSRYKDLSFEYTFLLELYWMISQMTYQFASVETGEKLMGDKLYEFDPTLDYTYKPVSQAIETEQSKNMKVKNLLTLLGYIIQVPHPSTVRNVNYVLKKVFELMGDDYLNFAGKLFDESQPMQPKGAEGGQEQPGATPGTASNQNGVDMSMEEQFAREGTYGTA